MATNLLGENPPVKGNTVVAPLIDTTFNKGTRTESKETSPETTGQTQRSHNIRPAIVPDDWIIRMFDDTPQHTGALTGVDESKSGVDDSVSESTTESGILSKDPTPKEERIKSTPTVPSGVSAGKKKWRPVLRTPTSPAVKRGLKSSVDEVKTEVIEAKQQPLPATQEEKVAPVDRAADYVALDIENVVLYRGNDVPVVEVKEEPRLPVGIVPVHVVPDGRGRPTIPNPNLLNVDGAQAIVVHRQLPIYGPQCEWVFNWAAGMSGFTGKTYLRSDETVIHNNASYTVSLISGGFKSNLWVRNLNVNQRFPWWDGHSVIINMTECRTLALALNNNHVDFMLNPITTFGKTAVIGSPVDRLWTSALAVLHHSDLLDINNKTQELSSRIKAHYQRSNIFFSSLDAEISELLLSKRWVDEINARTKKQYDNWEDTVEGGIKQRLLAEKRNVWWFMISNSVRLNLMWWLVAIVGCIVPIVEPDLTAIGYVIAPVAVATILSLCRIVASFSEGQLQLDARETLAPRKFGIKCAAKIRYTRTSTTNSVEEKDRLADVVITHPRGPPPKPDYPEEKVDCHGSCVVGAPVTIPGKSSKDTEDAVICRMSRLIPFLQERRDSFIKFAIKTINSWPKFDLSDTNVEEYIRSHNSAAESERILKAIVEPMDSDKDHQCGLFTKDESYVGKDNWMDIQEFQQDEEIENDDFKPRMIWSCPIKYKLFCAYFSNASKKFKHWAAQYDIFYSCGESSESLGELFELLVTKYFCHCESDVSNWDGSLFYDIVQYLEPVLNEMWVGMPDSFDEVKQRWGKWTGVTSDNAVKVTMEHGRCSGHPWTSIYNTIINVLFVMWCYDVKLGEFGGLFQGDDNTVHLKSVSVTRVERRYSDLGLKCKIVDRTEDPGLTEFCSGKFWVVDGRIRWGSKPLRFLAKFGIDFRRYGEKRMKGILLGTCKSMLPNAGHVPILGAFLRALLDTGAKRNLKAVKVRAEEWQVSGGKVTYPAEDTYGQFSMMYGISVSELKSLEAAITSIVDIDNTPYVFEDPIFAKMFQAEVGDAVESMNSSKPRSNIEIVYPENQDFCDVVYNIPYNEEIEKLAGCDNAHQALKRAYDFGAEENELAETTGHEFLHMFFTFLSWINLSWGVSVHSFYNRVAYYVNKPPAAKKKLGKKSKNKPSRKKGKGNNNTVKSVFKSAIRDVLIGGAGVLGGMSGIPGGSEFGRKTGGWFAKISGMGDYKVQGNTLWNGNGVPTFGGGHTVRVRHREFLMDISGSTAFECRQFVINPGEVSTFPWLSKMANLYTQYRLEGLVFDFNSTSASALNSTNTALGTVIMATRYNPYDPVFTSKVEAENHEYSTSCKPSESCAHPVECKPSETPFMVHYVKGIGIPGQDRRLEEWGVFSLCTVGMQAAAVIGELWVTYDIVFEKPRLNPASYGESLHARIRNGGNNMANDILGVDEFRFPPGGNMPMTYLALGSGVDTLQFPEFVHSGRFLMYAQFDGSIDGISLTLSGCAVGTTGWGFVDDTVYSRITTYVTGRCFNTLIDVTAPKATIRFVVASPVTDCTTVDVQLYHVPDPSQFPIPASLLSKFLDLAPLKDELKNDDESDYEDYLRWKRRR